MKNWYLRSASGVIISLLTLAVMPAQAQNQFGMVSVNASGGAAQTPTFMSSFDIFKPKPRTDMRRMDYQVWDDILGNIVVDFGMSSRIRSTRPQLSTGTRIVSGHTSPYRLEGSRVAFGYLNDNYRGALTEYREDLVNIANQLDISRLSRDEQLSFWFNLHNVAMIEQIAKHYPEDMPSTLLVRAEDSQVLLDDLKFIEIRGKQLSLRNIREDIVFSNWTNPVVIYGFFRGDIGSPRMLRFAFTASNLEYRLNGNANEFVNSLRGFHESRKARRVSKVYDEAKPFYFKDWPTDIESHLRQYAEGEALVELGAEKPFEFDRYETKIADLSGGYRKASGPYIQGGGNLSPATARLLNEVGQKQEIIRRRGGFSGRTQGFVIIEDIETNPNRVDGATID